MSKEDILWITLVVSVSIIMVQAVVVGFGIRLIEDLKYTANSYKSSENICEMKLDSLAHELERWQNE